MVSASSPANTRTVARAICFEKGEPRPSEIQAQPLSEAQAHMEGRDAPEPQDTLRPGTDIPPPGSLLSRAVGFVITAYAALLAIG
jgi:hypothetical protein